ncbi:MAG: hypothetical protein EB101_08580, partial [Chitinophagia bacterium]|nr:hypothetical protein [Chitinophagia bacterium]
MRPPLSSSESKNAIQYPADVRQPPFTDSKIPPAQSQPTTFTTIHATANTTPYPNGKHADNEKGQNNARQALRNGSSDINDEEKQQQRERLQSKKTPGTYSAKQFSDDLKKIKDGHTELNHPSSKSSHPSNSHPSSDQHDIRSNSKEDLESSQSLQKLINDIRECNTSIQRATESNQEKEAERLKNKLASLQQQYAHLRQTRPSDRDTDSDSSVGPPSETSDSDDSWSSSDTNSPSANEEVLLPLHEYLSNWEEDLKKNKTELVTKTRAKANKEEIDQCQQEVDALQKDIEKLKQILQIAVTDPESTPEVSDFGAVSLTQSPPQSPKGSIADVIRRTKTGRRNHPTSDENTKPTASSATPTPLEQLHESSTRNSALLSREDLKPRFTNEAQKSLAKIDKKIEVVAKSIDNLLAERNVIQKKIKKSNGEETRKKAINEIRLIEENIKKLVLDLARLVNRQTLLEELVLPSDQQLTIKQKNAKYEETLSKYKSENTLKLEADYKQKRADYERKVLGSRSTHAISMLAGSITNFFTFFWGNSLTRILAGALPQAASYIGGALSGLLHVVVGGPVLKQASSASWNAPALTEFNNYWKVAGSLWGDRLRAGLGSLGVNRWVDENHKKKYRSPNLPQTDFVDIEQLWQQTGGLWPLFKARYVTEEAAYFSYAMNFTFKAAGAAGLAQMMATKSDASRAVEWIFHSVMGWFSGAETVAGIQTARSQVPGAVESAIPSQEIHAAHAAMLQSLLNDLEGAYRKLRTQTASAPGDSAERDLLKAIRRTKKALDEAKTKSGHLGTFWFEFLAQFKTVDARADAAAEVLGRILSVMPSAMLSNLLASWRVSGNPWLTFGG